MGAFLISVVVLEYFCLSRNFRFSLWYIELFFASSLFVCLIGILHFFDIDILEIKTYLTPSQKGHFVSTIGNINIYTAYVAIFNGMAATLFCLEKKRGKLFWYFICMIVSFMAIATGKSDNAYLALIALFLLLPLHLVITSKGISRVLVVYSSFASVIYLVIQASELFVQHKWEDSLLNVMNSFINWKIILLILWGVTIFSLLIKKFDIEFLKLNRKKTIFILLSVYCGLVLLIAFAIYDVNVNDNQMRYGSLALYLEFNESWGSNRGWAWKACIDLFSKSSTLRKLIGYGPETFGILMNNEYYYEMAKTTGLKIFTAHNEYLHYLVTIGLAGLLSYLSLIFAIWTRCLRKNSVDKYSSAIVMGTICYCVQAVVSSSNPIVSPVFWTLLFIGLSQARDTLQTKRYA